MIRALRAQIFPPQAKSCIHSCFGFICLLQGYGYLDEISAVYGLIWQNPKLIASILYRIALNKYEEPYGFFFLKNGFQKVWDTIVEKELKNNIHYNVDIQSIKRTQNNVDLLIWNNSKLITQKCDWMVFTPPLEEFLRLTYNDSDKSEYNLFATQYNTYFTASLFNSKKAARKTPYNVYMENVLAKKNNAVMEDWDQLGALIPDIYNSTSVDQQYAHNTSALRTASVLQLGRNASDIPTLNAILLKHYKDLGAEEEDIIETIIWPYFHRWNPADMEKGTIWDVFDIQGKARTWFAGRHFLVLFMFF